ncbi:acyltransferase family protein [Butyrivibrio sp. FC2001]|uniref:acyltransferase family protein n=1 Tax=Butyrivibrio sp. FC2001 TaxID=1280671 RepID=UPI000400800E|nr:acyltransferase [Butyrivibrio sp. FC2001]
MKFDGQYERQSRIVGLDIYRILAVLFIFLFHSNIHIQCQYGFLTPFINMGAIYMTAFFILSGFSLYLTWNKRDLHDIEGIKKFYSKRLIGILPLYYAIALLYIFLLGQESPTQNLLLAPTEILGIQSTFNSLFAVTHNGGTWFVSCILLSYLVYPLIQEITKQIRIRSKVILILIIAIVLLHSPFIVYFFGTSGIYSNPFFRILEFTIGVLLCSMMTNISECKFSNYLFSWWAVIVEYIILIAGVTVALKVGIPGDYMLYSWVALPMFMLLIVTMTELSFPRWMQNSKIIGYLCEISYAFFFGQYFTWKTTLFIISKIGIDTNILRIVISFISCSIYTILLHEIIEKPITRFLKKKIS